MLKVVHLTTLTSNATYRYNISLTINSSGSDRPYDPVTEACMDVAVTVADWDVIEQNEDLD